MWNENESSELDEFLADEYLTFLETHERGPSEEEERELEARARRAWRRFAA